MNQNLTRAKTKRSIVGFFNKFKEEGKQAVSVDHVLREKRKIVSVNCEFSSSSH